ncbi:hypothetical protein AXE85_05740 [Gemella sp. oral taxon 928]|uniref:hypothetical protein n=1 Tax=Gemella sp. oral taxon 928 TaxID=1785995 RepID=UPI00076847DC|nr:hypothetical protein [Gemella sp. oral taxon 928]AME09688.1 hypothetical protein AXE85_05740 [Gemella sp. oral taxon 928]
MRDNANLKAAYTLLSFAEEILEAEKWNTKHLKVLKEDLEGCIESKSIAVYDKIRKLNKNQDIVLKQIKKYDDEYIISTLINFSEEYELDKDVENSYTLLNEREELEVIEEYIKYLKGKLNVDKRIRK